MTGHSVDLANPLRVAVLGTSRKALFLAETLCLRSDFDVRAVLVSEQDSPQNRFIPPGLPVRSLDEVLLNPASLGLEMLVVAGPLSERAASASRALHSGLPVLIEPPVCLSLNELERLASEARLTDRFCAVRRPLRSDVDFCQATKAIAEIGTQELRQVHFAHFDLAASLLPQNRSTPADELALGVLTEFGSHRLDQLLRLVQHPVKRASGSRTFDLPTFGRSASSEQSLVETGFEVRIDFEGGVMASITMNFTCPTRFQSGWVLRGTSKAYRDGLLSCTEEDGEVFDLPVKAPEQDLFADIAATLRHGTGIVPATVATLDDELANLRVQQAIRLG